MEESRKHVGVWSEPAVCQGAQGHLEGNTNTSRHNEELQEKRVIQLTQHEDVEGIHHMKQM